MIVKTHKGIVGEVIEAINNAGGDKLSPIESIELSRAEMDEFMRDVPKVSVGKYYGNEEIPQILNIGHNRDGKVTQFYWASVYFFCTDRDTIGD